MRRKFNLLLDYAIDCESEVEVTVSFCKTKEMFELDYSLKT